MVVGLLYYNVYVYIVYATQTSSSNKYKSIILKQKRGLFHRALQCALTSKDNQGLIASIIDQFVTYSTHTLSLRKSLIRAYYRKWKKREKKSASDANLFFFASFSSITSFSIIEVVRATENRDTFVRRSIGTRYRLFH